jgi:hypothetical protein
MQASILLRPALTWIGLGGLYLLLAGQASTDEVVAAGACAALGTGLAMALEGTCGPRWVWPGRAGLRSLARAVAAVPGDVLRVGRRLLRWHPAAGGLLVQPPEDPDAPPALAMWSVSLAPNRYLVGPVRGGRWLLHRLVP